MQMQRVRILGVVGLLCAALGVQAANIPGRLFYSASQRAALDAARAAHLKAPVRSAQSEPGEAVLPGPELTLNGIISSEGRTQLLINNQVRDARPGEVIQGSSARVSNQRGRSVDIKVGQRLNPYTGRVENEKPPTQESNESREPPQR